VDKLKNRNQQTEKTNEQKNKLFLQNQQSKQGRGQVVAGGRSEIVVANDVDGSEGEPDVQIAGLRTNRELADILLPFFLAIVTASRILTTRAVGGSGNSGTKRPTTSCLKS